VGRRGTRGIAGRRQGQAGQAAAGRAVPCTFDLGDNWQHLCTVAPQRADPLETLGIIPVGPLPCWGRGDIPDQYGRRWDGDDGSSPMPKTANGLADLPPILPGWEPRRERPAASPADGSTIRYRDLIT
jgi:hypothetical protein